MTQIRLSRVGLSGGIPEELGQLASLQVLLLYDNQLSGSIPKELGQLGLDYNEWSGSMSEVLRRLALASVYSNDRVIFIQHLCFSIVIVHL